MIVPPGRVLRDLGDERGVALDWLLHGDLWYLLPGPPEGECNVAAVVYLEGAGPAVRCQLAAYHAPRPLRFVWHHIQPAAAGGATIAANLAQVCDNCHYAVHVIMWQLANSQPLSRCSRAQLLLARQG